MAKKKRNRSTLRKPSTHVGTDDTKFYIKFKDPRIKSQIFYYFSEEDIFDPCIPLNDGDVIHDSKLISLDSPPPELLVQKPAKKPKKVAPTPKPKPKPKPAPKPKPKRVINEETFQVAAEDLVDEIPSSEESSAEFDDSFEDSVQGDGEDLAYMTAMDIQIVGSDEDDNQLGQTEDEEEIEVLEEVVEIDDKSNSNRFKLNTAIEPTRSSPETFSAVSLSKEEFEKNTKENDIDCYKEWKKNHLDKNTLMARPISLPEFRLLKKVVGLKKK